MSWQLQILIRAKQKNGPRHQPSLYKFIVCCVYSYSNKQNNRDSTLVRFCKNWIKYDNKLLNENTIPYTELICFSWYSFISSRYDSQHTDSPAE